MVMTFDEIDELVPNEGSNARARRTSWRDGVFIERGGWPLFRSTWREDGTLEQTPVYPGFRKTVLEEASGSVGPVKLPRISIVTWSPSPEDREADDWVLL